MILAVGALVACGDATGPNGGVASRIELRVRPSRVLVATGDTRSVRLVARNRSDRTIRLDPGRCTPLAYEIRDASGARVAADGFRPCAFVGDAQSYRLRPGASTIVLLRWAAVRGDGRTRNEEPQAGQPLPADRYALFAALGTRRDDAASAARSAPVAIAVTATRSQDRDRAGLVRCSASA